MTAPRLVRCFWIT